MSKSQSNKKAQESQLLTDRVFLPCALALKEVADAYGAASIVKHPNEHHFRSEMREQAVDAMLRRLATGSLLARCNQYEFYCDRGKVPFADDCGTIPKQFWAYARRLGKPAHQDWLSGDFTIECIQDGQYLSGYAHSVRFDRAGLPLIHEQRAIGQTVTVHRPAGGAPRKWEWDGALAYLAALSHCSPDGLHRADGKDPTQSDIAEYLEAWFIGSKGESPAHSQLRKYAKLVEQEINALKMNTSYNQKVA